jgi:cyanophycinase
MQTISKLKHLCAAILLAVTVPGIALAQQTDVAATAHVRPIVGSRMVVGDGKLADYTVKCFLHLCHDVSPKVVVINLDGSARITENRLKEHGAGSVLTLDSIATDAETLALQLLGAGGVWIEGKADAVSKNALLLALLKNVTQRNGVIAVGSSSLSLLSDLDDNDRAKRLRSPFASCEFHFGARASASGDRSGQKQHSVHCSIPNSSVLVVHGGRRIAGYGNDDIRMFVKKANGWPARRSTFECPDVFSSGSYPFYGLDLLSWIRSANERGQAAFPPKEAGTPVVKSGTLFLHGGSRIQKDVMREFVKLVGDNQPIVCIPSASQFDWSEEPDSYSAEVLGEMGYSNVTVLHTDDPYVANENDDFADLLSNAKGVWIDGGRTYRFMDCYQGTRVEKLIADVLKRGGVVGGSSAGCQVPSDFLVRGNPRTNRAIVHDGYTRGMGLLKGVIIDAHFLQRGRHEPFLGLMQQHPQMLGIGIDERTALVVKGHTGRVIGPNAVSFYDLETETRGDFKPVILKAGGEYDLKLRKSLTR